MADRRHIYLLTAYVLASGWAAYETVRPAPTLPASPQGAKVNLPSIGLPLVSLGPASAFDEITERPLFIPGRRAPASTANTGASREQTVATPDSLPDVRLTAVISDGARLTALIEDTNGQTQAVGIGQALEKWQVDEIFDDRIVLTAGARRHTLELHQFAALPAIGQPPPRARARPRVVRKRPATPAEPNEQERPADPTNQEAPQ